MKFYRLDNVQCEEKGKKWNCDLGNYADTRHTIKVDTIEGFDTSIETYEKKDGTSGITLNTRRGMLKVGERDKDIGADTRKGRKIIGRYRDRQSLLCEVFDSPFFGFYPSTRRKTLRCQLSKTPAVKTNAELKESTKPYLNE